jgi:hypothetical protein
MRHVGRAHRTNSGRGPSNAGREGTDTCISDHSAAGSCPAPTIGSTCWFIPTGVACPTTDPKPYHDCGDDLCHSYCEVLVGGAAFYGDATCP